MKALRFFFLSLLAAFSFAASAQTIEVYKDGRVIDSFTAAQVDSVVYAPAAAEPRYYYYAGWTKPSESNLANLIVSTDINGRQCGGEITNIDTSEVNFATASTKLTYSRMAPFYVVVPTQWSVFNNANRDCTDIFSVQPNITFSGVEYRVLLYDYEGGSRNISFIKIHK